MELEFFLMSAFAGLMGTYTLMMLSCWADSLGLPRLDFSRPMANLTFARSFEEDVPPGAAVDAPNTPYWPGMAIVYVNGIFFALLYPSSINFLTSKSTFLAISSDIFCCLATDRPRKTSSSFSP